MEGGRALEKRDTGDVNFRPFYWEGKKGELEEGELGKGIRKIWFSLRGWQESEHWKEKSRERRKRRGLGGFCLIFISE